MANLLIDSLVRIALREDDGLLEIRASQTHGVRATFKRRSAKGRRAIHESVVDMDSGSLDGCLAELLKRLDWIWGMRDDNLDNPDKFVRSLTPGQRKRLNGILDNLQQFKREVAEGVCEPCHASPRSSLNPANFTDHEDVCG